MFEWKIALKYLLPKKNSLSTSLISWISIGVITLVVWLVLVFLSVTTGIENNWLKKLTALNAPLRITPTDNYYSSYYYQADKFSSSSSYEYKTIDEKFQAAVTDPYQPDVDMEISHAFPKKDYNEDGIAKDYVKELYGLLTDLKQEHPSLAFQDYQMAGALMRLQLHRKEFSQLFLNEKTSSSSQMSYILSFPSNNPNLRSLILPPSVEDLNNILYQMDKDDASPSFQGPSSVMIDKKNQEKLLSIFQNIDLKEIEILPLFFSKLSTLTPNTYSAYAYMSHNEVHRILLTNKHTDSSWKKGTVSYENNQWVFKTKNDEKILSEDTYWQLPAYQTLPAKIVSESLQSPKNLNDISIEIQLPSAQTIFIPFHGISIKKVDIEMFCESAYLPPWIHFQKIENKWVCTLPKFGDTQGILLPKNYQSSKALIGDSGYLGYVAPTCASTQEMRQPFYVGGFYDPGILQTGNRCLFVPPNITRMINAHNSSRPPGEIPNNGLLVWIKDLHVSDILKKKIESGLKDKQLENYFNIQSYRDYEFSKELLQQFQSDRTLFSLIAIIILIVACSNVISLLILLVHNKKKEIAILESMGASRKSIAIIFGLCGGVTGLFSSILGTLAAIFTLHHLETLVAFLSFLQGHAAFQTAFYGDSLPNDLSIGALTFVLITTPILALIAGLVPAIKACKLKPSTILRSE